MSTENCIFCRIASGQIPSKKIYEDTQFMAFHDIHPAAPVHFLIIPKMHIASLFDVTKEEHQDLLGSMLALAPKLAREQGAGNGFKTLINTGQDGGQEVYHLHVHVIGGPRPWGRSPGA
jgi:histidine triad (HIT) family protein